VAPVWLVTMPTPPLGLFLRCLRSSQVALVVFAHPDSCPHPVDIERLRCPCPGGLSTGGRPPVP
jgi:hypothetical protein